MAEGKVSERARWPAIFGYCLLGVFSAAQLGKMSALMSWRAAMAVGGGLALLALVACAWSRPRAAVPSGAAAPATAGRMGWGPWCLALCFGCCTLYEVGLLALLPSFLVQRAGASAALAAHWTAVASVAAVLSSLVAAALARPSRCWRCRWRGVRWQACRAL